MDNVKIGGFIKECRKEKGLTQEQLAEKLNVSKNAVSKWERGICLMDMALLKPLSEILGITIVELLNGEKITDETSTNKSEEIIPEIVDHQSRKNRKKENIYILIIFLLSVLFIVLLNFSQNYYGDSLEFIFIGILGLVFIFLGVVNFKGNISSIHWYHRRNIKKENVRIYGKLMGVGTIIIGLSMLVTGVIKIFYKNENMDYIIVVGLIIGIILMLYAQIIYNKGIF